MILGSMVLFVAFEQNYLSPIFITSASDWIRLLLCKGKFPAVFFFFFAGSGKFY